jgi:hypothetical protein
MTNAGDDAPSLALGLQPSLTLPYLNLVFRKQ